MVANKGQVVNTLSSGSIRASLTGKPRETILWLSSSRKNKTPTIPRVLCFRFNAERRCLRKPLLQGCRDRQTQELSAFEGPALILRNVGFFFSPLPSNGINTIGRSGPSNDSPQIFFLWELKSEAQTLTLNIFQSLLARGLSADHYSFSNSAWAEALWCHVPPPPALLFPLRHVSSASSWRDIAHSPPSATITQITPMSPPGCIHPAFCFLSLTVQVCRIQISSHAVLCSVSPHEYAKPFSKKSSFPFPDLYPRVLQPLWW